MFRLCFLYSLLFAAVCIRAQKIVPYYGPFPEPVPNKNLVFYLQRTVDRNTVMYELNYEVNGELNPKKPIKVYWIDFEDGAKISPLTFAQSKFAYGVESKIIDEAKKIYQVHLVSYKKVKIILSPGGHNGSYQAHTVIKGKPAVLNRIFVNIIGGSYLKPVVSFIELTGKDLQTGAHISEKIKAEAD